jgi:hypothetical protein
MFRLAQQGGVLIQQSGSLVDSRGEPLRGVSPDPGGVRDPAPVHAPVPVRARSCPFMPQCSSMPQSQTQS